MDESEEKTCSPSDATKNLNMEQQKSQNPEKLDPILSK